MEEVKLKPCPCCGGEAKVSVVLGERFITCEDCNFGGGLGYSEVEESWNTRPTEEALEARLQQAVKALEYLACYADEGANERLAKTGSYRSFDEPSSVYMARKALAACKEADE